jgi:excisionase family DNA binding protein
MSEPEHSSTILRAVTTNSENRFLMEPLLLTPRDAAKALSVCERTLYSLTVPRGEIPVIRAGRLVRYSVEDLKTWIKKSSENS